MDALARRSLWSYALIWSVAVLSLTVLALAAVTRNTLLNPGFYGRALEDERAYQRFYDQVLVDPHNGPVVRDLLGRLPVPQSTVTANLKVVIPAQTLRAMGDRQIAEVIRYLEGDRDTLRLTVDLGPIVANIERISRTYFADAVASLQQRSEPDYQAFVDGVVHTAGQLVAGHAPVDGVPLLALSHNQAVAATSVLMRLVPESERAGLRPEVEAALLDGDVASALAAVAPAAVTDQVRAAAAQLLHDAQSHQWLITTDFRPSGPLADHMHRARFFTRLFQDVVEPSAAVLGAAALTLLWLARPDPIARRLVPLGWALTAAAALTGLVAWLGRLSVGDPPFRPPSSWSPTAARLIVDVQTRAMDRLLTTATLVTMILLAAGALLVTLGWAWQTRPGLPSFLEPRHGLTLTAAVSVSALVATVLAPVAMTGAAPRICQGSARLCGMRYDQIAQVAAHNAMATTANRFIGPLQDPDIVGQLNAGVRVLLIDTHHWEHPREVADRLGDSEFSPQLRRQLVRVLGHVDPYRPGLWLCHSVCGAGALALTPTLRQIGDWLRDHPTEIVTLIVQDGVSPAETRTAFEDAGLDDLLYVPDEDPDKPWPKLKDMIDDGRRLVVFAEKADGPAPWYRNFYRYGMETPFAVHSPQAMTCEPNRGGTDKRLFLLNNFVSSGGGRRLDAGVINSRQWVLDRVHACERQRGRPVNFIAVDYATVGDVAGAVDTLNTERLDGPG
ncbi:PI-PLC domain-containing protein [Streptomyces sp. MS06]|uniref:PI-PLC domain-containing protein n=1 Tax=Streptomyces sp. MS06 TaxID=3385974 RepID=UPI00399F9CF8